MRNFLQRFLKNLFSFDQKESQGEILFYRIFELFLAAFVLRYAWEWAAYIPRLGEVILPLGLANYIDISFMFSGYFALINACLMTLFLLLALFRTVTFSYLIVILLFHLQYVARFSQGEISHGSNMVGMCIFIFAVGFLAFNKPSTRRKFNLGMIYFYIGLSYTSAALSKLIGTGPHWMNGRHLWLWIGERSTDVLSQHGAFELNMLQEWIFEYHWLATLILLFGLTVEFFGFLFWFKKFRPYIVTFIIAMHFGIEYSMNITFSTYVYVLILTGYPWAKWLDKLITWRDKYKITGFLAHLADSKWVRF